MSTGSKACTRNNADKFLYSTPPGQKSRQSEKLLLRLYRKRTVNLSFPCGSPPPHATCLYCPVPESTCRGNKSHIQKRRYGDRIELTGPVRLGKHEELNTKETRR